MKLLKDFLLSYPIHQEAAPRRGELVRDGDAGADVRRAPGTSFHDALHLSDHRPFCWKKEKHWVKRRKEKNEKTCSFG